MVENKPPENSVRLTVVVDEKSGELHLASDGNIPDTLDPEYADALIDLSLGLNMMIENAIPFFINIGSTLRLLDDVLNNDIDFEPADELLDSIPRHNVVPFNKKKLN